MKLVPLTLPPLVGGNSATVNSDPTTGFTTFSAGVGPLVISSVPSSVTLSAGTNLSEDAAASVLLGTTSATNVQIGNTGASFTQRGSTVTFNSTGSMNFNIGTGSIWFVGSNMQFTGPGGSTFTFNSFSNYIFGNDVIANNLTFGISTSSTFLNGGVNMPNLPVSVGTVAVPTHTPPAGFNYVVINGAGQLAQFSA